MNDNPMSFDALYSQDDDNYTGYLRICDSLMERLQHSEPVTGIELRQVVQLLRALAGKVDIQDKRMRNLESRR